MKKWLTLMLAAVLVFSLSACNSSSDDSKSGGKSSSLSLEEVYKKTVDRQNEIKSMSSDMKMDMKMSIEEGGQKTEGTIQSDFKMDMTNDPLTVYMTGAMKTLEGPELGDFTMDIKAYMNEDTMYMFDSLSNTWTKMPLENMGDVLGQNFQVNSAEQFKALEPLMKDFKMKEEDGYYVLTLEAANEKFTEFILEQMDLLSSLQLTEDEEEVMKNIKYDKVNYVIKVAKDTFDITAMDLIINITLVFDGVKMKMETDSKITYSNFDKVDKIEIPKDVVDNAVEMGL